MTDQCYASGINPYAIPGADLDPDGVVAAADGLSAQGASVREHGADALNTWRGLAGHYEAPEASTLFVVMDPVETKSRQFGDDVEKVAAALKTYAEAIRPIKASLATIKSDAYAFRSKIASNAEWEYDQDLVDENTALVSRVNAEQVKLWEAERTCANAIRALYGAEPWHAMTGEDDPLGYGLDSLPTDAAMPWGSEVERKDHCPKSAAVQVKRFVWDGVVVDGLWGTVVGLGQLVGIKDWSWSWDTMKTTWVGMGGLIGYADGEWSWGNAGNAWLGLGKGLISWDTWEDDPGRAAGGAIFNVATIFIPAGAAVSGSKGAATAAGAAGKAARVSSWLSKGARVLEFVDPISLGLKGVGALPKLGDLLTNMKMVDDLGKAIDIDVADVGTTLDDVPTNLGDDLGSNIPVRDPDRVDVGDTTGADVPEPVKVPEHQLVGTDGNPVHDTPGGTGSGADDLLDGGTTRPPGSTTGGTDAPTGGSHDPATGGSGTGTGGAGHGGSGSGTGHGGSGSGGSGSGSPVDPPKTPVDPPANPVDPPTTPVDPPTGGTPGHVDPPKTPVDPPTSGTPHDPATGGAPHGPATPVDPATGGAPHDPASPVDPTTGGGSTPPPAGPTGPGSSPHGPELKFTDVLDDVLYDHGLNRTAFRELMQTRVEDLTRTQVDTLLDIRSRMPAVYEDTLLQKVITPNQALDILGTDAARFFDPDHLAYVRTLPSAQLDNLGGFVSRLLDIDGATTAQLYHQLGLNYPGSPFTLPDSAPYSLANDSAFTVRYMAGDGIASGGGSALPSYVYPGIPEGPLQAMASMPDSLYQITDDVARREAMFDWVKTHHPSAAYDASNAFDVDPKTGTARVGDERNPFRGSGWSGASSAYSPELAYGANKIEIPEGAEMWRSAADGSQELVARYVNDKWVVVPKAGTP
ncbi:hypothetical protein CTKZ_29540 [Cellulomonas algicola]|uniref:Uncharacterized protein n=1 Tax=Cellulomonas algicola TaxID=2071633 RepID=A0A401V3A7_9CELL|nr:hypothetical protein [Cellulomonas algicola]GCD21392.1 hypothetical protein CTKZ_29540 [Cellulomonas algicola]